MRILAALLIILAILGCSDFDKFYREKKERSPALRDGTAVVARIGSQEITKEEVVRSLNRLPVKQRILYLSSPERLERYLDSYVTQQVLYKEAQNKGIGEREDIKRKIDDYEKRLLIQALGQEVVRQEPSEEELKKYYSDNAQSYERVRVSRIFIKIDPGRGMGKTEAQARAAYVSERIKSGEKFERLVEQFSDDLNSKKRGGNLGYVQRGRLSAELEEAAFSLGQGQISGPIEAEDGFHIVRVEEGVKILPFDQVKGRILIELRKERVSRYVDNLREQMKVEVFADRLR